MPLFTAAAAPDETELPLLVLLQVKIAELPLDSFRMLQALEWEDQFSSAAPPATEHPMPLQSAKSSRNAGNKLENGSEPGAQG
jgi:hypothetical protein